MMIKTELLEQAFLFEMLLNKYAFETQNLISIINSVLDGKVHTSVLTSQKIITELQEIKMTLPVGSALPIEINAEHITELFRISEISILNQDKHLIYIIEISLISYEEYHVYHPISLLIQYDQITLILINPEIDYLALSTDNEKFFSFTSDNWETCKPVKNGKICKGDQLIHHRSEAQLCEVAVLFNAQTFPETCNLKFITVSKKQFNNLA